MVRILFFIYPLSFNFIFLHRGRRGYRSMIITTFLLPVENPSQKSEEIEWGVGGGWGGGLLIWKYNVYHISVKSSKYISDLLPVQQYFFSFMHFAPFKNYCPPDSGCRLGCARCINTQLRPFGIGTFETRLHACKEWHTLCPLNNRCNNLMNCE